MKVKEIIEYIGKDVIIITKDKEEVKGHLSNTVSSLESPSGKDEVEIIFDGIEYGVIVDDIIAIRLNKHN